MRPALLIRLWGVRRRQGLHCFVVGVALAMWGEETPQSRSSVVRFFELFRVHGWKQVRKQRYPDVRHLPMLVEGEG